MKSDLSEAPIVMVEGRVQLESSREKEEIPGATPPEVKEPSPSVSHCWEHRGAEEAGESEGQMLVNLLIDTN